MISGHGVFLFCLHGFEPLLCVSRIQTPQKNLSSGPASLPLPLVVATCIFGQLGSRSLSLQSILQENIRHNCHTRRYIAAPTKRPSLISLCLFFPQKYSLTVVFCEERSCDAVSDACKCNLNGSVSAASLILRSTLTLSLLFAVQLDRVSWCHGSWGHACSQWRP